MLNRVRLTVYSRLIVAIYIVIGAYLIVLPAVQGTKSIALMGKPLGFDFSNYWTSSWLALAGEPTAVYDFPRLAATQETVTGVRFPLPFPYPPTYLLMILPLSLLPYLASMLVFLTLTLLGFLFVIYRTAPHPLSVWLTLSFPGTFQNFFQGQNGFLSATLLGGGLLLLNHFPFCAGMLLGLLSYKPHLAGLIPVALLAGRHWQALGGAILSAASLALASVLVFGWKTWVAFFHNISLTTELLNSGRIPWFKVSTFFAAVFLAGGKLWMAYMLQGIIMLMSLMVVIWTWRKSTSFAVRNTVLTSAILLFTPYAFDYDLTLLGIPLVWMGWEAYNKGWIKGEQTILVLVWLMPLIATVFAKLTYIQLGPPILIGLIILALKRWQLEPPGPAIPDINT